MNLERADERTGKEIVQKVLSLDLEHADLVAASTIYLRTAHTPSKSLESQMVASAGVMPSGFARQRPTGASATDLPDRVRIRNSGRPQDARPARVSSNTGTRTIGSDAH